MYDGFVQAAAEVFDERLVVIDVSEGRDKPLSTFGAVKTLDISIPELPSAAPAPSSGAATP